MIEQCGLSERRACRLVGLSRDSWHSPPGIDAMTQKLSSKIVEIAHVRRRFGYRRIHDMLRSHFPGVNYKRRSTGSTARPTWPCASARRPSGP